MKKRSIGRRVFAAILAAAVSVSGIPVTSLAAGEAKAAEEGLIASFHFDNEEEGFTGAGAKAVVNGTATFEDSYGGAGKALAVSESTWLSVYRDDDGAVLEGLESFTLSYDSKATNQKNGWAFYAAPDLNPQQGNGSKEHYLGIMDKASGITVERFNNNGSRPGNDVHGPSSEAWKHVDLVVTEDTTTLYVNGVKANSTKSTYKMSDILGAKGGIIQIGKANWGNGEYFEGLIDNVKIYNRTKSEEEIRKDSPIEADAQQTDPFASYAFNGDTADSSQNAYNGTLVGSGEYVNDGRGGIVFPSGTGQFGQNYVKLDDGILTQLQDAKELTVTAWVRNDVTDTNSNSRGAVFAFGSDPENLFAFATLNWASARATFVINGTEMGGQWGNNDNTSLLGNTPGNRPSPLGKWYQVALTMRDVTPEGGDPATTLKYYMDGELLCNLTTPSSISALGDLTYAYIGTGNIKDYKDFEGGIRGVDFIGSVLSQRQIAEKYEKEELFYAKTDEEIVKEAVASLTIPNADDIRGNITLPDIYNGASVSWTSSNEDVVSTAVRENEGYDSTPAGVVTRGSEDVQVRLTAIISKGAVAPAIKDIDLTVKAKSEISEEDYKAYVFAYFTGEGYATGEQIYFATSQDGLHWEGTNEGDPVLSSTMGEQGLRDPFIIRSPEGDRFYLIATDLKINGGNGWTAAQQAGSQSIMVWESTDMVNWTDQRMVKVARDNAGCTWAPEAFYDEKTGEYIVFWASKTSDDNYSVQKVYYAKTRDFYTFTEPEVWIELYKTTDGRPLSIIDTSVISVMEDGKKVYYRFSKNEAGEDHDATSGWGKYTIMERSDSLLGEWTEVKAFKDNRGVEGGTCFKFNGEDKWCLLLDDHGGVGYFPMVSTDLGSGEFTRLDTSEYSFPSKMRHGTVLPLTQKEYDAVMAKYSSEVKENQEEPKQEPILKYDFENVTASGKIEDTTGNGQDGLLCGNAKLVEDADRGGKVLRLNGTKGTFASLPTGLFDGRNQVTVSMDVKAADVTGNYFTFTVGRNDKKYIFLKTEDTSSRLSMTVESGGNEQTARGNTEAIKDRWANFTMVVTPEKINLYVDGLKIGEQDVTLKMTDLGANLVSYLGKSFYSADKYFNGYFDNVEVFNRAMDDKEIADRNGVELPKEKVTVTYKAGTGGRIEGEAVQTIEKGSATTEVTAVADEGYEFVKWSDGKKEAARSDSNVTADVRYTAEFVKKEVPEEKVTVTYVAGEGGKIEGEAVQPIKKGGATTEVTAVADEGYEFAQWSDGNKEATRSDSNVTKNVEYTAEFVKKDEPVNPPEEKVTVTYLAGKGGKIQGTAVQPIDKGADTTEVTAVADPGYTFSKWSDGVTSAKRIDRGVTASKEVTALFTENPAPDPDVKPDAASVKLSEKKLTMGVKEKVTLKATVLPAKADQKVTFTSSNKKVASVNAAGKITGKKAGKARITVKTANGKKSICVVTVKKAPKKISVKPKKKTLKVGKSLKLKVVLPKKTASYKRTFKSSRPKVAVVSAAGKVTAKKKGAAVITVRTFNGKKARVKITVR